MASTIPPLSMLISSAVPPGYKASVGTGGGKFYAVVDVVLRFILFTMTMAGIVIMATFKQTKMNLAGVKFNDSPDFIYYATALSVACLYTIITGVCSVIALMKPNGRSAEMLLLFVVLDSLLLGIMASATGAAGAIAYTGFIGDTDSRGSNLYDRYSSFSRHIAASVLLSLLPSLVLLLLVRVSALRLSKKMAWS